MENTLLEILKRAEKETKVAGRGKSGYAKYNRYIFTEGDYNKLLDHAKKHCSKK